MKRVPLDTKVMCRDGEVGRSTKLIVSPETLKPTHVVVREAEAPHTERLVAIAHVVDIGADVIQLDLDKETLAKMPPFAVKEYREVQIPRYAGPEYSAEPYAYMETQVLEVRKELVPEGERAVGKDMEVRARDDDAVGIVDELIADDESGTITHFIMREQRLWGDRGVVIPLAAIDHVDQETVYLKVEKETIKSYVAAPMGRREALANVELIILLARAPGKPADMLKTAKEAAKRDGVEFISSAVLAKDAEGKTTLRESDDLDKRQGRILGAVTGGLLGLLGGPAGVLIGAAAGAVTGGAAAKRIDLGLPDSFLKKLEDGLQPGSAAVVALAPAGWDAKVTDLTFGLDAELLRHQLTDDVLEQLPTVSDDAAKN